MPPTTEPPSNPNVTNRNLLLGLAVAGIVIVIAVISLLLSLKPKTNANTTGSSPSPSTTASATPAPTPTPIDAAKAPAAITFTGLQDLLSIGITNDEISDLKYAFTKYIKSAGIKTTSVDINSVEPVDHDRNSASTTDTVNFNVNLHNPINYTAKFDYTDSTAGRLYLYDTSTGAQVFDSGTIDLYNGIGD